MIVFLQKQISFCVSGWIYGGGCVCVCTHVHALGSAHVYVLIYMWFSQSSFEPLTYAYILKI